MLVDEQRAEFRYDRVVAFATSYFATMGQIKWLSAIHYESERRIEGIVVEAHDRVGGDRSESAAPRAIVTARGCATYIAFRRAVGHMTRGRVHGGSDNREHNETRTLFAFRERDHPRRY